MRQILGLTGLTAALLIGAACDRPDAARAENGTVDSVIPRDSSLALFRRGLPRTDSLKGGASSIGALVREFAGAVERSDTTALRGLALDRSEFAWIYYPDNPEGLPPYDLSPQLMWFTLEARTRQGLTHLLQSREQEPLNYVGYRCEGEVSVQGANRLTGPCLVRRRTSSGAISEERLFGLIIERHGRFKFVSLANRL